MSVQRQVSSLSPAAYLFAAAALAAVPSAAFGAAELTADQIANKANLVAYYAGKDGRARVLMKIYDAQGRTRSRMMTILRYDIADGGEQRYYVYFHRPSDVQRMVYMVWKHPGQDDDRWLYMPALDLVKRIAAGDKRTSFVGSHFLYEDVSGRGVEEDTHELMPGDAKHYVLKNVPKDPSSVEFSYYIVWIDKQTFMPMKAEYYDKTGKKYRIVEAVKVETIQGHPTVTQSKATDLNSGGYTLMRFGRIVYDTGMPLDIFQERYLRRPPMKWIK